MFFSYATTSSTHIAVEHHRLVRAELTADLSGFKLWIESWPTEAARLDGIEAAARWHLVVPSAGLPLVQGLPAAIVAAVLASDEFSGATHVPDASTGLGAVRVRQWAAVKAERSRRLVGTLDIGGNLFDVSSGGRLAEAAVAALVGGSSYTKEWVLADNTVVTLTGTQVKKAHQAIDAYVGGLWATSQALRATIFAPESTEQDVLSAVWPL